MKKILFTLCIVMCSIACSSVNTAVSQHNPLHNTLTKQEIKEGWSLLWNGEDLSGWKSNSDKDFTKGWSCVDGVLSIAAGSGAGDIITERKYHDFELSIDFKFSEGANSGIKYFIGENACAGAGQQTARA